jgi:hypothetical protein
VQVLRALLRVGRRAGTAGGRFPNPTHLRFTSNVPVTGDQAIAIHNTLTTFRLHSQLTGECSRGVWYPVACAKQVVLKQVLQLPKPLWREVSELVGDKVGFESRLAYGEATEEDVERWGDDE